MPVLYIHAGMPKTGTTAIQSFLSENQEVLAKRSNLYYPSTGTNPLRGGTHQYLFPIKPDVWAKLHKEVAAFSGHDVVLSEEIIFGPAFRESFPQHWDIVRQTFPGYDIKIVIYIRRLDDYSKSAFVQMTAQGSLPKMPSYAEFLSKNMVLSVCRCINAIIERAGKDNVLFRLYDRKTLKDGDAITDFFDLLGRNIPEGARRPSLINLSIPAQASPFLSHAVLPLPFADPLRLEILELLRITYAFPKGSGVGEEHLAELEAEIDKIDAYVPGYKQLFAERKLSFSFPEVDVQDPQNLFLAALLYKLLMQQRNAGAVSLRGRRHAAPLRALAGWLRKKFGR